MKHCTLLALAAVWILTTASSCQTSFQSTRVQASGEGAAVVVVVLVAAGIACLASEGPCGAAEPSPLEPVQAAFRDGLARVERGDPAGWGEICVAGHQGYAKAQYAYGVHLFRQAPDRVADKSSASLAWLRRAAAQDHKAARHLLARMTAWPAPGFDGFNGGAGPVRRPLPVAPPALRACTLGLMETGAA